MQINLHVTNFISYPSSKGIIYRLQMLQILNCIELYFYNIDNQLDAK